MAMPARQRILRKIIRENPCSLRALARQSGVPHASMIQARDGERNVTPDMAKKIVAALRQWAATCNRLADDLEATTPTGGQHGE
jgi:hypothetical protein